MICTQLYEYNRLQDSLQKDRCLLGASDKAGGRWQQRVCTQGTCMFNH